MAVRAVYEQRQPRVKINTASEGRLCVYSSQARPAAEPLAVGGVVQKSRGSSYPSETRRSTLVGHRPQR